ncbi:M20 family metallopeptidase [Streptomyces sp. NPDC050433]|uniref:M20 family metallopeptidase n=1 Tax=Streptomyces sp. NPDC050433 TaxID=3365615 RepID=UPI003798B1B2
MSGAGETRTGYDRATAVPRPRPRAHPGAGTHGDDAFGTHTVHDEAFADAALFAALERELPAAVRLRRELHAEPRVSGDEGDTLDRLLAALPPDAVVERLPGHAAVARIGPPGPAVALRAELDALPLAEETGLPWAARNGAMHACGHDVHMAAVAALARAMAVARPRVPVVVVCQPREETYPSGAFDVLASAALERHDVRTVLGAHVQPTLPTGSVACTAGVVNASADEFTVTMSGVPGHAAYPHLNRDPVLAASQFVVSAQQIVSRNADPMLPAVLTVGSIDAGSTANATPADVVVRGTLRSMDAGQRTMLSARVAEIADGIALAHGCRARTEISVGEPALVNDPGLAGATAGRLAGAGVQVVRDLRSCGADDFAYFCQAHTGLMLFVGTGPGGEQAPRLHSSTFAPPDGAVRDVAMALAHSLLSAMTPPSHTPEPVPEPVPEPEPEPGAGAVPGRDPEPD